MQPWPRYFHSLNRRMQLMGMAGLGVVVVGVLSVLSGSMGHPQSIWRLASGGQSNYLEIALDQPAFPIPKAPTAASLDLTQVENQGVLPVESELFKSRTFKGFNQANFCYDLVASPVDLNDAAGPFYVKFRSFTLFVVGPCFTSTLCIWF